MEASKYLVLLLILITIIAFGFYILFKGIIKKDNGLKYFSLALIGILLTAILYNIFPNFLTDKPSEKELVGIYKIVSADNGIPKSDYKSYTLDLKKDGTFEFTQTPGIKLCKKGNYELDYSFENNEISFQCENNWTPKHLKRKLFGFEIEFYIDFDNGKSICFEKIE
ncbi:hypothetical protein [Winogradskyella arenosi]|uniref:Uncharacterized protein n=1 Tax=Winogradskyella arenosi TaxID=533325 RepID=A0A368ZD72_9FLAO|nr:hypothetical protein [Winogradskyella arenosi]RCW89787.1 hypothetical protein DFQ08_1092 [Winogradskyella arenosi]